MKEKKEKKFFRNCPKCNKELGYTTKSEMEKADKNKGFCRSCSFSGRKYGPKIRSGELSRKCPNPKQNPKCERLIYYRSSNQMCTAEQNKSKCPSCRSFNKEKEKQFYTICPNFENDPKCKQFVWYSTEKIMEESKRNNKLCRHCIISDQQRQKMSERWGGEKNINYGKSKRDALNNMFGKKRPDVLKRNKERTGVKHKNNDKTIFRDCPNPKDNPNCSKILYYNSEQEKKDADYINSTCISCALIGKERTDEQKKNISKGRTGCKISEEARKRLIQARKKWWTPERRKRCSEIRKKWFKNLSDDKKLEFINKCSTNLGSNTTNNRSFGITGRLLYNKFYSIHFRSSVELFFLLSLKNKIIKWKSGECKEYAVTYINKDGYMKFYFPDFVCEDRKLIIEIKPKNWMNFMPESKLKHEAAKEQLTVLGYKFIVLQLSCIKRDEINKMRLENKITLSEKDEKKYLKWLEKHNDYEKEKIIVEPINFR